MKGPEYVSISQEEAVNGFPTPEGKTTTLFDRAKQAGKVAALGSPILLTACTEGDVLLGATFAGAVATLITAGVAMSSGSRRNR